MVSLLREKSITSDTVVMHSSGNHAQVLALAAKMKGLRAHIVMPNIMTKIKKEAVRGYGADITECEPTDQSRAETVERVVEVNGVFVSPANVFYIMAGQGTMALEILEQVSVHGSIKGCFKIVKLLRSSTFFTGQNVYNSLSQIPRTIFLLNCKLCTSLT